MHSWRFSAYIGRFFGGFVDIYAMLYTKMFHGRDIMKHLKTWGWLYLS